MRKRGEEGGKKTMKKISDETSEGETQGTGRHLERLERRGRKKERIV